jgi:hypothetical protein
MNMLQGRVAAVVLIASAAVAARAQTSSTQPDPAGWAPADALFYIGVTDFDALQASFRKTAFSRMLEDPASKSAPGQAFLVTKFIDEIKSRLAKLLQTEPEKLRSPFGGPLAAFVLPPAAGDTAPQAVLVASVRDRELMKDYYDKVVARLREQSDQHEMVAFGSDEIASFSRPSAGSGSRAGLAAGDENEEDFEAGIGQDELATEEDMTFFVQKALDRIFSPDALPEKMALCLSGDRLVVATGTADPIRDVLRSEKRERCLLESEDYRTLLREFQPAGPVRFFVNLPRLFELASTRNEQARNRLSLLGVQSLRNLVGHVDYGAEAYDGKFEALVQMSGERTGLPRILAMKNRAVEPARSVSSEVVMFASVNVSALEVLDEVERMVRQADPSAADQMRSSLREIPTPDGTLDLRKELFENLREPLTFAWSFVRPYGPDSPRMLLSIGHKDRPAMERLLATLSASTGLLTQRELAGVQIFDVMMWGFSLATTSDAVLLGNPPAVEAHVQAAPSESLTEDAAFRRAARLAPREAWLTLYVDSYRMCEAALGLARHRAAMESMSFTNPAAMMSLSLLDSLAGGEVNEQKVEAARKLLKYQAASIMTITTTTDGIRLTSIQLKPESP